jgi:hypothetical protein
MSNKITPEDEFINQLKKMNEDKERSTSGQLFGFAILVILLTCAFIAGKMYWQDSNRLTELEELAVMSKKIDRVLDGQSPCADTKGGSHESTR